MTHLSEVVEKLHLFLGAVGREATKLENPRQLSRVVLRVDDKYGGLDVGVGVL